MSKCGFDKFSRIAGLALGGFALVATSPPPSFQFVMNETLEGQVVLTDEAPRATIVLKATAREPEELAHWTDRVAVNLTGSIRQLVGDPEASGVLSPRDAGPGGDESFADETAFVSVTMALPEQGTVPPEVPLEQVVLTQFDLNTTWVLKGDCQDPSTAEGSCSGELHVDFERTQAGASSPLQVNWTLRIEGFAAKAESPSENVQLPWDLELMKL